MGSHEPLSEGEYDDPVLVLVAVTLAFTSMARTVARRSDTVRKAQSGGRGGAATGQRSRPPAPVERRGAPAEPPNVRRRPGAPAVITPHAVTTHHYDTELT